MSSKGNTYNFYLSPYSASVLNPVSIIKTDHSGDLYSSVPTSSKLFGIIGVSRMIRPIPELIDVRKRAGLLNVEQAYRKQNHVDGYCDIGYIGGRPYQGNCVLVARIPTSVRTTLQNRYFDFGINSQNIPDAVRTIVDTHYSNNGNYLVDDMSLSTDQVVDARRYISFIDECRISAESKIKEIVEKYATYGSYVVIVYK